MLFHKRLKRQRRGIAVVEFAVILPLIVLLLLGAVEVGRGVMVAHTLQEAAQAGCRVYSVEDTTFADATAIVNQIVADAGITNHTIVFDPPTKAGVNLHMEPVTVAVSVPFIDVAWLSPNFMSGATLEGRCVMPADVDESDGGDTNGYTIIDDDNNADGVERVQDPPPGGDDDD